MATETQTAPQLDATADTSDEVVHYFCCDPDRSWCGLDISHERLMPGDDQEDPRACALCLLAMETSCTCSPGCPGYSND